MYAPYYMYFMLAMYNEWFLHKYKTKVKCMYIAQYHKFALKGFMGDLNYNFIYV